MIFKVIKGYFKNKIFLWFFFKILQSLGLERRGVYHFEGPDGDMYTIDEVKYNLSGM